MRRLLSLSLSHFVQPVDVRLALDVFLDLGGTRKLLTAQSAVGRLALHLDGCSVLLCQSVLRQILDAIALHLTDSAVECSVLRGNV